MGNSPEYLSSTNTDAKTIDKTEWLSLTDNKPGPQD